MKRGFLKASIQPFSTRHNRAQSVMRIEPSDHVKAAPLTSAASGLQASGASERTSEIGDKATMAERSWNSTHRWLRR